MATHSISVIDNSNVFSNPRTKERKKLKGRNLSSANIISVISTNEELESHENNENMVYEQDESVLKCVGRIITCTIATVGLSVLAMVPWTTIPRTNSIIYQSYWMEVLLPCACLSMLIAGSDMLNLTIWTKERSLLSTMIFLKMAFTYIAPFTFLYVFSYIIWSIYLGYNHPMPYIGLILVPVSIIFMIALWILLPSRLMMHEDFRKKIRMYTFYFAWCIALSLQNEVLSFLFTNLPADFQFIVAFMIAACREFDKKVRSKFVTKMMGKLDEPASALIAITISSFYGSFVAFRIAGATIATVLCVVSIDFAFHSHITYQLIKEHNRVKDVDRRKSGRKSNIKATKLILAELVEGLTPMVYAICMAMAFYGPNNKLFVNIGSTFWGQPIEDINNVFRIMGLLYTVDTISAAVNSMVLWRVTKINMLQEFSRVLTKYWLFIVIKLGYIMTNYFVSIDVNFGADSSGKFEWITSQGRLNLIYNSTYLTAKEILIFENFTLV